ncbi:MAG: hypothetical protein ACOWWR_10195 [Eubacteriales bacterium]
MKKIKLMSIVLFLIMVFPSSTFAAESKDDLVNTTEIVINSSAYEKYEDEFQDLDEQMIEIQKVKNGTLKTTSDVTFNLNINASTEEGNALHKEDVVLTKNIVEDGNPVTLVSIYTPVEQSSPSYSITSDYSEHSTYKYANVVKMWLTLGADEYYELGNLGYIKLTRAKGQIVAIYDGAVIKGIKVKASQFNPLGGPYSSKTETYNSTLSYNMTTGFGYIPHINGTDGAGYLRQDVTVYYTRGTSSVYSNSTYQTY